jgi:hypothetical protein
MVLEDYETVFGPWSNHAEVLGGNVNSGGQRGLGTMTAQIGCSKKCIQNALKKWSWRY